MKNVLLAACLMIGTATAAESFLVPEFDPTGLEPAVAQQIAEFLADLSGQAMAADLMAAEEAELYGQAGRLFQAYGFLSQAVESYQRGALLDPSQFAWPYLAALAYSDLGQQQAAINSLRIALAIRPAYSAAVLRLAAIYRDLGDLAAASLVMRSVEQSGSKDPAVLAALGEHALALGQPEKAVAYLEQAVAGVPQATRLNYLLGQAYRSLGDRPKARDYLARAGDVGISPADPELAVLDEITTGEILHLLSGRKAYRAGDFAAARGYFQRALAANPDSVRARVNLAAAEAESGNVDQAIAQLEVVLGAEPDNVASLFNLATLEWGRGRLERADQLFGRLLTLQPTDTRAHLERARLLIQLNRPEDAQAHLTTAKGDLVTFKQAALTEIEMLLDQNRVQQAMSTADEARSLLPADSEVALTHANLMATAPGGLRDSDGALELARRVFEFDPSPAAAESVALALASLDRCSESVQWLTRAIELAGQSGLDTARLAGMRSRIEASQTCRP